MLCRYVWNHSHVMFLKLYCPSRIPCIDSPDGMFLSFVHWLRISETTGLICPFYAWMAKQNLTNLVIQNVWQHGTPSKICHPFFMGIYFTYLCKWQKSSQHFVLPIRTLMRIIYWFASWKSSHSVVPLECRQWNLKRRSWSY